MLVTRARNTSPEVEILVNGVQSRLALADMTECLFDACAPIRTFRWHRGQKHFPGWYWSATNGAHVMYESRLELARLLLADFEPRVMAIRSQPFALRYTDDCGRVRRQIPDFALLLEDGAIRVVNVKPAEQLQDPDVRAALEQAHAVLERRGFETEIWSGMDPQTFANIRYLAMFRDRRLFSQDDVQRARSLLHGPIAVTDAEELLATAGIADARSLLLHLIWQHALTTDLSQALDGHSMLEAN